jgi:hypothetical protein
MCLRFQFCTHQRVCVLNFLKKSQICCTLMCIPVTHICVEMLPCLVAVLCVANKTCNRVGRQNPQKAAASVRVKVQLKYRHRRIQKYSQCLKGQCHEIVDFWFFHESVFPKPLAIPLGPFRIFSKIRNGPNGILWGWGELIHEKTRIKKSRDTVPLRAHTWSM